VVSTFIIDIFLLFILASCSPNYQFFKANDKPITEKVLATDEEEYKEIIDKLAKAYIDNNDEEYI
jgi:hypothetical protein